MSEHESKAAMPVLIHLTEDMNTLAAIFSGRSIRAMNAYGAANSHRELHESQKVVCLSEIGLPEIASLAKRHGAFGLGIHRGAAQQRGAAPVWYLPRDSPLQTRLFELVKSLAFRRDPVLDHFIWEFTPFIDYPKDAASEEAISGYDWRWEREWRVRGDLSFDPPEVAFLVAPEDVHDVIVAMWLWEVLDAYVGVMPPIIDTGWPLERQLEAILVGPSEVTSDFDEIGGQKSMQEDVTISAERDDEVDSAPAQLHWVDDGELTRTEQREEWSIWLNEMEADDL